jgi:hypothetical protein
MKSMLWALISGEFIAFDRESLEALLVLEVGFVLQHQLLECRKLSEALKGIKNHLVDLVMPSLE